MSSNLLIHIGYHKTGTTWLQKELFVPDSKAFAPLCRPADADPKYLGRFFVYDEEGYMLSPFQSGKARILRELASLQDEIEIGSRVPVISCERLSGSPQSSGFDTKVIADRLHDCFPDAKIFCVLREQKEMILSNYHGYLKKGGTASLKTYLTRKYDGRMPGFSPQYLVYNDLVEYYRKLFSPENVLVLPYEMFQREPAEFIARLARFSAADVSFSTHEAAARRVHNKRPRDLVRPALPFLNVFARKNSINAYSPLYVPGANAVLQQLNRMLGMLTGNRGPNRAKQHRLIDAVIGERYEASNRRLGRLIEMDLSEYGYHDDRTPSHPAP